MISATITLMPELPMINFIIPVDDNLDINITIFSDACNL